MTASRATSFGVVLMLAGLASWGLLAGDDRAEHRNPHLKAEACARDRLAPSACALMEGDHVVPLGICHLPSGWDQGCLNQLDVLSNIQMQPCDKWAIGANHIPECVAGEAYRKDRIEWHWAALVRSGKATEAEARDYFLNHKRCPLGVSGCW